jgi:hypothetical protein
VNPDNAAQDMEQFQIPRTFQAKPSSLKKKIALILFVGGAIAFTLALAHVIEPGNGMYFFVGGILAMAFSFRFWNMQVRAGATAVTFDARGITIANRSASNFIEWADLAAIRYKATRGGHYWEFKARSRDKTFDYYVDGLSSTEQNELREAISSIKLLGVLIEPFYNPMGVFSVDD